MGWIKRYRNTRGFGVHSPFAFRLITDCINERHHYYAYSTLATADERLLYRLALFFQPSAITALGSADAAPALMACPPGADRQPPVRICAERVEMAVAGPDAEPDEAARCVEAGQVLFLRRGSKAAMQAVAQAMSRLGRGQLLHDGRSTLLAVPLPWLPSRVFEISFPS